MRVSKFTAAVVALGLSGAAGPAAAQSLDDVRIEAIPLSDHVAMLTGQGGEPRSLHRAGRRLSHR